MQIAKDVGQGKQRVVPVQHDGRPPFVKNEVRHVDTHVSSFDVSLNIGISECIISPKKKRLNTFGEDWILLLGKNGCGLSTCPVFRRRHVLFLAALALAVPGTPSQEAIDLGIDRCLRYSNNI